MAEHAGHSGPTARTRVSGVAGWPIEHSLSPTIHNAAYRALGLDRTYVAFAVPPGGLERAVAGLAAAGLSGLNVTMPHKEAAAELLPDRAEDVERLRAANVLTLDAAPPRADNTDVPGFARFLSVDAGFDPSGGAVLVFGAGGAARAVALAVARAGAASVTAVVREPARARALREALDGLPARVTVVSFDDAAAGDADLVVNATPLGGEGEMVPARGLRPGQVVVDLVYRPAVTPFVAAARAAGAEAHGGLGLLLHQAALTVELWTGQVAPLDVMSAAALAELAEDPRAGIQDP